MNPLKFYIVEISRIKWKNNRLMEMVGVDVEDAVTCVLMEFPDAGIEAIYQEVKL